MKVKIRKRKPTKGGAVDLPTLMLADTFHDFWNCSRGIFAANAKFQALLNYGILTKTKAYLGDTNPTPDPYIPRETPRGGVVADIINLLPEANRVFGSISEGKINVSSIEESTAEYMLPKEPTAIYSLSPTDLSGNDALFNEIVTNALGDDYIRDQFVHILCDAGFGNMGKVGSKSKLRGIITPQVIGDSANTSIKPIGSTVSSFFAPASSGVPGGEFISDSNIFTKEQYQVSYTDRGISENTPYNFSLKVTGSGIDAVANFSPSSNTGPSAALLGGCFLAKYLTLSPQLAFDAAVVLAQVEKGLSGEGAKYFRAHSKVLDIWNAFGSLQINPFLFIDLKRGGDRDQVKAAVLASAKYTNVIFCTGDLLCAVAAVKNGLPTIYQLPSPNKTIPAKITVWRKGVGITPGTAWGGATANALTKETILNLYKLGQDFDKLAESELLNLEEDLTPEDLLRDAAAQAACYIKPKISEIYKPVLIYSALQTILNEFDLLIHVGRQKLEQIGRIEMFGPLNSAIESYCISNGLAITQVNLDNFIPMFKEYTKLHASFKAQIDADLENQKLVRTHILQSDFSNYTYEILEFLMNKYEGKFEIGTPGKELYNYILTILNPYSEDKSLKLAYPGAEPVVNPHIHDKNLYTVGLVVLTLINDMISTSTYQTSVATNILFGTKYNLRYAKPLDSTTIESYAQSLVAFTRAVLLATPESGFLLSKEVYNLTQSGGRRRTNKHRKYRLKKRLMKTQHKRK